MATTPENLLHLELDAEVAITEYLRASADATRPDAEVADLHTAALEAYAPLEAAMRANPDFRPFFAAPTIALFAAQERVDTGDVVPTTTPQDIRRLQEAWRQSVAVSREQGVAAIAEEERAATVVDFQQREREYHSFSPTAAKIDAEAAALVREEDYPMRDAARARSAGNDI